MKQIHSQPLLDRVTVQEGAGLGASVCVRAFETIAPSKQIVLFTSFVLHVMDAVKSIFSESHKFAALRKVESVEFLYREQCG